MSEIPKEDGQRETPPQERQTLVDGDARVKIEAGGDVEIGGDVVGGDKVVHGDQVQGPKTVDNSNTAAAQVQQSPGTQLNTLQNLSAGRDFNYAPTNTNTTNITIVAEDTPAPFTRAWWLLQLRKHPLRFLLFALGVWLALALLLKGFPFHNREGWQSLDLNAPRATQIARVGSMLFVGGNNTAHTCDSPAVGLWRQPAPNAAWESVAASVLCFSHETLGKVLTDITGFASSPTTPERVYMATSNLGVLVSDKSGASESWYAPRNEGLTNLDILHVAAHPTVANRLYALGAGDGLYRSDNGGDTWTRLDLHAKVECPTGTASMSRILAAGALAVTPRRVIVGTGDPENLSPSAHVSAGLYVSEDDVCWRRVHGSASIEYRSITNLNAGAETILFHSRNWDKNPDEKPHELWLLALDASPTLPRLLWSHERTLGAVIARGNQWYAASELGQIFQGALDNKAAVAELPAVPPCFLACDVGFAPDGDTNAPLLLASPLIGDGNWIGGRVLRQGNVDWLHALLP